MTELERFAAVVLAAWQAESGRADAPLSVGDLLDRTLPYKQARRLLALETAEDYEALVMRLIAEEAGLVVTEPGETAEMARTTLASKVPDLDVLRLLRSASFTFSDDAVSRLEGVRPLPGAATRMPPEDHAAASEPTAADEDRVLPIRRSPEPAVSTATPPASPREAGPPPEFLTGVAFTPPSDGCWSCGAGFPAGRTVNFCVECGADQRQPQCASCGATVERQWKHCPECGTVLARQ